MNVLCCKALAASVLAFSLPAFGAETTYYFSGVFSAGSPTSISIPAGTPFTGTLTYDPTTPNNGSADNQHRNFYDPLATWNITIGSNVYQFNTGGVGAVGVEQDANYGANFGGGSVIWFFTNIPPATVTGTGEATNPLSVGVVSSVLLWSKPAGGILANANTFSEANILNLAQWTFAGLDFNVLQGQSNGEHYRGAFTSFSKMAPVASADLAITKNGSATVIAGQNIIYTIVAINNGPSTATSVMVSDATPPGTTFVSNSGACTTAFPCNLGTLTNGQSATITATYKVSSSASNGSTITNTATVSSSVTDPNSANNSQSSSATVSSSADLSITKTGPAGVTAGQNVVYTIVAKNNGPSDAAGVMVSDPTPPGTTFVSNSGACTTAFPCSLGTLTNGQAATITATYKVSVGAANGSTITNTSTVSSSATDPNSANNTQSSSATVSSSADLSITKMGPTEVNSPVDVTYTIAVNNAGPSNSSGVTVTDVIPSNTSFLSATPSQGSCSGTTTVTCSLGTINVGSSAMITLTVHANSGNNVTNTATVSAATADPNLANNTATTAANPVTPAPSSLVLLGTGMLGLLGWAAWRSRMRKKAT